MPGSTKIYLVLLSFFLLLFLLPNLVLAYDINQINALRTNLIRVQFGSVSVDFKPVDCSGGYCTISWIGDYIGALYKYGVGVAVILAVVMMMVGGLLWLMSGGSPNSISKAKDFIISAFTGLLLALFSFMMIYIVNPKLVNLAPLNVKGIEEHELELAPVLTGDAASVEAATHILGQDAVLGDELLSQYGDEFDLEFNHPVPASGAEPATSFNQIVHFNRDGILAADGRQMGFYASWDDMTGDNMGQFEDILAREPHYRRAGDSDYTPGQPIHYIREIYIGEYNEYLRNQRRQNQ